MAFPAPLPRRAWCARLRLGVPSRPSRGRNHSPQGASSRLSTCTCQAAWPSWVQCPPRGPWHPPLPTRLLPAGGEEPLRRQLPAGLTAIITRRALLRATVTSVVSFMGPACSRPGRSARACWRRRGSSSLQRRPSSSCGPIRHPAPQSGRLAIDVRACGCEAHRERTRRRPLTCARGVAKRAPRAHRRRPFTVGWSARLSWTFAAGTPTASGMPPAPDSTCSLLPSLPRSTGWDTRWTMAPPALLAPARLPVIADERALANSQASRMPW